MRAMSTVNYDLRIPWLEGCSVEGLHPQSPYVHLMSDKLAKCSDLM